MSPDRIERALVEVTREARTEILPDVDWEAIEDQLPMTRVHTVPPRAFNPRPWLLAAALAAGVGGLGFGLLRSPSTAAVASRGETPSAPVERAAKRGQDLDGDTLMPGSRVRAGDVAQSVLHKGHARWTLAPHSEGTLLTAGELVTIRLERGSVTSKVTKHSRTETFAVEAADVRVAAHGTEFVVMLGADGVSVSVTEGTVLVGPREEPGVGQLLISPSARRYTLTGIPREEDNGLEALGGLRAGGARRAGTAGASAAQPERAPELALAVPQAAKKASVPKPIAEAESASAQPEDTTPERPSDESLETTSQSVASLTQACFKARTIAGEGVRVTAQTSITFRTLPRGGVSRVVFEPPLSPAVQACVQAGVSAIQTDATKYGFQGSRTLELER
jgi:hypothetical protein